MTPILREWPRADVIRNHVGAAAPVTHSPMQIRMKSTGKHDWTLLLRARPMPQPEPESGRLAGSLASGEQQDWIANSKLERLAAELRALGIQF